MSLYAQWQDLIENLNDESYDKFWEEYSAAEIKIYSDILENPGVTVSGKFEELAKRYDVGETMFMGFLDGVNSSLTDQLNIEPVDGNTDISLDIDFEKLYFNMLSAQAEHLYTLAQWDSLLTEEKRREILKSYKRSKTVTKGTVPGRNDPCPCGSGKKYKKCCGAQ